MNMWAGIGQKDKALREGGAIADTVPEIPLDLIRANPQVRRNFEDIEELAEDIKERGVLQAIILKHDPENPGQYIVHIGERRFRAAKMAGLDKIPAYVKASQSEFKRIADQLAENIHRNKLDPLEVALSLQQMKEEEGESNRAIAKAIGKDIKYVGSHLAILRGPDEVRDLLERRVLSDVDAADNLIKVCELDKERGLAFVKRYDTDDAPTRSELRSAVKELKQANSGQTEETEAPEQPEAKKQVKPQTNPFVPKKADLKAFSSRPPEKAEIRVKYSSKGFAGEGKMLIDRADKEDDKAWVVTDDDVELRIPLNCITILSVK